MTEIDPERLKYVARALAIRANKKCLCSSCQKELADQAHNMIVADEAWRREQRERAMAEADFRPHVVSRR